MELGRPLLQDAAHDADATVRVFAAFWLDQDTGDSPDAEGSSGD